MKQVSSGHLWHNNERLITNCRVNLDKDRDPCHEKVNLLELLPHFFMDVAKELVE